MPYSYQVFSAFGFVHKIATFEKAAGFQALIQFTDAETTASARNALIGRSILRYLLPEHVASCHLRISYSAHTDLNIKFQSHRSRDYTNPCLPVNPSAIEGILQPTLGPDGKRTERVSNVLLASIENMQYAVTVDALYTVFSAFGTVQKIAIFAKNGGMQALVQYPDVTIAAVAKEALEGQCIYDGGYCKLHLSYSRHTDLNVKAHSRKSRDYTIPDSGLLSMPQASGSWQGNMGPPAQASQSAGPTLNRRGICATRALKWSIASLSCRIQACKVLGLVASFKLKLWAHHTLAKLMLCHLHLCQCTKLLVLHLPCLLLLDLFNPLRRSRCLLMHQMLALLVLHRLLGVRLCIISSTLTLWFLKILNSRFSGL